MLLYDAFNGGISASSAASSIIGTFGGLIPSAQASSAASAISATISSIANGGGVNWQTIGGAIIDVANVAVSFTPAGKYAELVSILWDSAGLM